MSNHVSKWGWGIQLNPIQKLVLMALADYADDNGYCWPSNKSIAKRCCISSRTVQRRIRELVEKDLLIVEHRERDNKATSSNGYLLDAPVKPKKSCGSDNHDTSRVSNKSYQGDIHVIPRTAKELSINHKLPNDVPRNKTLAEIKHFEGFVNLVDGKEKEDLQKIIHDLKKKLV